MRVRSFLSLALAGGLLWSTSIQSARAQPTNWPVYTTGLNQPSVDAIAFMVDRAKTSDGAGLTIGGTKQMEAKDFCAVLKDQAAGLYVATLPTYNGCFKTSALQAMDFPFLARDWTEAREILNGPIGLAIVDALHSNGVDVLSFWQGDARVLASNKPQIANAGDLFGSKVLGARSDASRAAVQAAGGVPNPLPLSEIGPALNMGLGDAVDAPLTIFQRDFAQFTRSALVTNHSLEPYVVVTPTKLLQGLLVAQMAYLESLLRGATAIQTDRARELQSAQIERLRDGGFNVTSLSEAGLTSFKSNALLAASQQRALQVFESSTPTVRTAALSQVGGQPQAIYFQVRFGTNRGRDGQMFTKSTAPDFVYGKAKVELEFDRQLIMPVQILRGLVSFATKGNGVDVDWQSIESSPPPKDFTKVPKQTPAKAPLIYVHGFANTFDEALRRGAWLGWNAKRPVLIFAWPSQGTPTPSNYRDDQIAADKSAAALAQLLRDVGSDFGDGTDIDIVVHSMGGRVVVAALKELRRMSPLGKVPKFRQFVLVAPDVGARDLNADWATLHTFFDRKATLYVSDHDLALGISRQFMNPADGPRAGLAPPVLVCENMESIFIGPNEFSLTGHSYHVANGVIADDLMEALRYGVSADDRRGIVSLSNGGKFYELRRLRTP